MHRQSQQHVLRLHTTLHGNKTRICTVLQDLTSYCCTDSTHTHTHTCLTALCPGLPGWDGTRKVKPIWILLKQESVSGSGISISWALCKSTPRSRQVLPFWYRLTRVVPEKGPLNGCLCVKSYVHSTEHFTCKSKTTGLYTFEKHKILVVKIKIFDRNNTKPISYSCWQVITTNSIFFSLL